MNKNIKVTDYSYLNQTVIGENSLLLKLPKASPDDLPRNYSTQLRQHQLSLNLCMFGMFDYVGVKRFSKLRRTICDFNFTNKQEDRENKCVIL